MVLAHFSGTLTRLRDNGVFASDEIEVGERVSRLAKDSRLGIIPFVLPVIIAVLGVLAFSPKPTDPLGWADLSPISYAIVVLNWMLIWGALCGVAISMAISGAALNSIFTKNKIIVHSLHPDKSGGFSPAGDFSFHLTIMALLPGIIVGIVIWQSIEANTFKSFYPLLVLMGLAYLVLVPTLFYLPIRGAHKAMDAFRHDLIKQTYSRYSVENMAKRDTQDQEDLTNIKSAVEQMDILKRLAKHESSYPVWPFGFRTRVGVFVNSVLPLTLTFVGIVVQML